jgi:hypothetical protein
MTGKFSITAVRQRAAKFTKAFKGVPPEKQRGQEKRFMNPSTFVLWN